VSEVRLTPAWVARATGGTLEGGDADRVIREVVIDSRLATEADLFIAIRGPRFDGHDFVAEVLAKGAAAAIVERNWQRPAARDASSGAAEVDGQSGAAPRTSRSTGAALVAVDDTLRALQDLARAIRKAAGARVIAITGSAGKTTTKETIAELLGTRWRVVKNKGNLNNHIGLPLSLMQLRHGPDVAVMELGMNHAGEISTLVAIAEPDVRVWTNVGDAHLGFFASPDAIADAKAEILERADGRTLLVCNADDPRIMARVTGFPGRVMTFGTRDDADVRAVAVEDRGIAGMRAQVTTPAGSCVIDSPLLGRGNLANVLAAAAVAVAEGVPLDDIAATVARLRPADRRGAVVELGRGVTLIDDSYNSSPAALRRALEVLGHERRRRRAVAVLGEMLELGDHSLRLHAECGRAAADAGVSVLISVGGAAARELADAAVASGIPPSAVAYFASSDEAAPAAVAAIEPGDVVLVKGSRGVRTDVVADRIAGELG
jgi:UDP-N-acetylmuramoyl-tripeptide--D-alanyl-D-alanine ligase